VVQTVLLVLRVAPTGKRPTSRHRFRNWKATRTRSQFRNSAALVTRLSARRVHRRSWVKVITQWGRALLPSKKLFKRVLVASYTITTPLSFRPQTTRIRIRMGGDIKL